MKSLRTAALCLALLTALLLGGCGAERGTVRIQDRGVVTELDIAFPASVADILAEAEIVLHAGDRSEPAPETVLDSAREIVILRENLVRLTVGDRTRTVCMTGGTVRDLLEREGVVPGPGERLSCDKNAWLTDGMEITLSTRCTVEILYHGSAIVAEAEADTVGCALQAAGIIPEPDDRVTPGMDEALTDGMRIVVSRMSYAEAQELQPIRYDTRYERDESLEPGTEQLLSPGVDGEKRVFFRITYADGVEESRELIREEVLREPVEEVVLVGPKDTTGLTVVSKKVFYDCDGSGHGYYEITYSDGSVEYIRF